LKKVLNFHKYLKKKRLEKFRDDKAWHECMKLSELEVLRNKNEGKLASGKHFSLGDYDQEGNLLNNNDEDEPFKKKKKSTNNMKTVHKTTVSNRFKGVDSSYVDKIDDLLMEKEFCVVVGNEQYSKSCIEKKIIEYGGQIVQNPDENTFCIITTKLIHKINSYIKKDLYDVVKLDWLIKCIEEKKFIPWKPSDMLYSKLETRNYFNMSFDMYGDSFEKDVTPDSLKQLFKSIDSNNPVENNLKTIMDLKNNKFKLKEQIALIENKYFPNESFLGLFRLDILYLDIYQTINQDDTMKNLRRIKNSKLDLIELKVKVSFFLLLNFS
jgi:DNA ligase-4